MNRLAALLLLACAAAFAQSADPKTCSIDGAVTNSVTHAPIPRAQIEISLPDRLRTTQSDAAGKWNVENLPCGAVAISVSRIGYIEKAPVALQAPTQDIKLELTPQVVLAGRVIDDQGDPIQNAHVGLLTSGILEGRRTILSSAGADTNDLGEYRFSGLSAGRYILCASAKTNSGRLYSRQCLPGTAEDGAGALQAAAGYEGRIDFTLSPLPVYRLSGKVEGAPSEAMLMVRADGFATQSRRDGTFVFPALPAGDHRLFTETERGSAETTIVITNADVEGVRMRLEPRVNVSGIVHARSLAGKTIGPRDYNVFIWAGSASVGSVNETGQSFTMNNVIPGQYHFNFTSPKGFYLNSATVAGRDVIAPGLTVSAGMSPLEVTISDDGGALEGDVTADDAPTGAWIYLERDGQPVRNGQADSKGHFHFDAVPPGDYNVYAWDDNSKVEYANPAWMQRYGKPVSVSIAPGQSAHVKLVRQIAPE